MIWWFIIWHKNIERYNIAIDLDIEKIKLQKFIYLKDITDIILFILPNNKEFLNPHVFIKQLLGITLRRIAQIMCN